MGGDGAHLGVGAERALETILGGKEQPSDDERVTPEQMAERILAAAGRGGEPASYGDCADMAAGMVLALYRDSPGTREWPAERGHHYELEGVDLDHWQEGARIVWDGPDLYKAVSAFTDGKLDALGITGFQWGWAVNAARFALGAPAEPNPAIITIREKS